MDLPAMCTLAPSFRPLQRGRICRSATNTTTLAMRKLIAEVVEIRELRGLAILRLAGAQLKAKHRGAETSVRQRCLIQHELASPANVACCGPGTSRAPF